MIKLNYLIDLPIEHKLETDAAVDYVNNRINKDDALKMLPDKTHLVRNFAETPCITNDSHEFGLIHADPRHRYGVTTSLLKELYGHLFTNVFHDININNEQYNKFLGILLHSLDANKSGPLFKEYRSYITGHSNIINPTQHRLVIPKEDLRKIKPGILNKLPNWWGLDFGKQVQQILNKFTGKKPKSFLYDFLTHGMSHPEKLQIAHQVFHDMLLHPRIHITDTEHKNAEEHLIDTVRHYAPVAGDYFEENKDYFMPKLPPKQPPTYEMNFSGNKMNDYLKYKKKGPKDRHD